MTTHNLNGQDLPFCKTIEFDTLEGFEVCWAGPHPYKQGFCFGSDDGRLLETDENGLPPLPPGQGSAAGEAINGVAANPECLGVSTRADIAFIIKALGDDKRASRAVFPAGSHGLAISPSGHFVAPLGLAGLLVARPMPEGLVAVIACPKPENTHYFYRAIVLQDLANREAVVCALRRSGVGVLHATPVTPSSSKANIQAVGYPDLDVVDVCALGGGNSLAAAAVGADGTLILFKNVLLDKKPATMKFNSVKGKVYRVLSCRGHVFLLTNTALYILANLANRFLWGESLRVVTTPAMVVPMEAVDANLYRDKFLLVVLAENKVLRLDLELMETTIPENLGHGDVQQITPTPLDPVWEEHGVEQDTRTVAVS
jgi:hypothetical protein